MGIFYDKKAKSWKAEVYFQKKRIASRRFKTKGLAEKFHKEKEREAEERSITGSIARNYTYGELYEFWIADGRPRKRATSLIKDEQNNLQYISKFIGHLRVNEIDVRHFNEVINFMLDKELSKATINLVIQQFKAVFNYAFDNELIARNPAKKYKQFKLEEKEMDFFTQEEVEQLLRFTSQKYKGNERWKYVLYLCFFSTGLRLGETLGLQWNKILWDKDFIAVNQMWSPIEKKIVESTKGKKNRLVLLSSELKKELGAIRSSSSGKFIFSDSPETPIDSSNFRRRIWTRDLNEAGLRYIRIHDSRHTFASLFMMNNGPQFSLMSIMGHSAFKTTERYSHLSPGHLSGLKDVVKFKIEEYGEVKSLSGYRDEQINRELSQNQSTLQIHSTSALPSPKCDVSV